MNKLSYIIMLSFWSVMIMGCAHRFKQSISIDPCEPQIHSLKISKTPKKHLEIKLPAGINDLVWVNANTALLSSHRGELHLLNLENGEKKRIFHSVKKSLTLLFFERETGIIYFTKPLERKVYAYHLIRNKTLWKMRLNGIHGNMVVADTSAFFIQERKTIIKFDKIRGKIISRKEINQSISNGLFKFQNKIGLITEQGQIQFYDINLNQVYTMDLKLNSNPVINFFHDRLVGCDSDGRVVVFNLDKRKIEYEKKFSSPIYSKPLILENVIIFGLGNGQVIALSSETGEEIWCYQGDGLINHPLVGNRFMTIVPFARGQIIAFESHQGMKMWEYSFKRSLRLVSLNWNGVIVIGRDNQMTWLGD